MDDASFGDPSLQDWRARRVADLIADDGWLNLTDRVALRPGAQSVGSAGDNDVVISVGPARLGVLEVGQGRDAWLTPAGGGQLAFAAIPECPPRLLVGRLLLEIHAVEDEAALRVRDLDSPARTAFAGLRWFPADPSWRVTASWTALEQPEARGIEMVGGRSAQVTVSHRAAFVRDGKRIELTATHVKAGKPMFVFRDATAQDMTYGAGRFLIGTPAGPGSVTLDFNRAFNPPCAFSDFAICPLPPAENILPFRVEAGELRP